MSIKSYQIKLSDFHSLTKDCTCNIELMTRCFEHSFVLADIGQCKSCRIEKENRDKEQVRKLISEALDARDERIIKTLGGRQS